MTTSPAKAPTPRKPVAGEPRITRFTLWLCQKSYWKWPFYSGFSQEKWWFSIAMLNYQRVIGNFKMRQLDRGYPVKSDIFWGDQFTMKVIRSSHPSIQPGRYGSVHSPQVSKNTWGCPKMSKTPKSAVSRNFHTRSSQFCPIVSPWYSQSSIKKNMVLGCIVISQYILNI